MSEAVMTAPKFERLLHSASNISGKAVNMTFLGSDQKKYSISLDISCAALSVAAIASHLGELYSGHSDQVPPVQPIVVKSAQTAMRDNGNLALILTLETGAELPLEFAAADLSKLSAELKTLSDLADPKKLH